MSDLPPTKKIRLLKRIPTNEDKQTSNTSRLVVFEWTEDKILFLTIGYTRIYIKMCVNDISSIIFKYLKNLLINYHINHPQHSNLTYMSNNNIICNIKTNSDLPSAYCTIIFTPYISTLLTNKINKSNKFNRKR